MFVWVYRYRYWDAERLQQADSRDMFTMDAIRAGLGNVILQSGKKVSADHVDASGRLKEVSLSAVGRR